MKNTVNLNKDTEDTNKIPRENRDRDIEGISQIIVGALVTLILLIGSCFR